MAERPVLVVIGGLSATGKTTVASALVRRTGFAYVRIDSIEQAIVSGTGLRQPLGPAGYLVGYAVAADQLRLGVSVVAESVNPLKATRDAWRGVAEENGARALEVELTCSDMPEHRRRAETRVADIAGLDIPDWDRITGREYEPWDRDRLVIDTVRHQPADAVSMIIAALDT